jgi:hypothetical protein
VKRIVLAAILVAALALASVATGSTRSSKWLTIAQAKHKIAVEPVFGWTCDTNIGGGYYCGPDYMRSVSLHILSGTIRGIGGSLRYKRKTYWQNFFLNVKCASDFRSGQQFHGKFEWGWNGTFWETTNPQDRNQTGRVYPGCTG